MNSLLILWVNTLSCSLPRLKTLLTPVRLCYWFIEVNGRKGSPFRKARTCDLREYVDFFSTNFSSSSNIYQVGGELTNSPKPTRRSRCAYRFQFPRMFRPLFHTSIHRDEYELMTKVAVFGWNFCIALAAGNSTIWKPSPTTPL
jgi:hypothetical protein